VSDAPDDDDSAHRLRILVAQGLGVTPSTAAATSASRLSIAALDSVLRLLLLGKTVMVLGYIYQQAIKRIDSD
jgi:hypothetical protein